MATIKREIKELIISIICLFLLTSCNKDKEMIQSQLDFKEKIYNSYYNDTINIEGCDYFMLPTAFNHKQLIHKGTCSNIIHKRAGIELEWGVKK